MNISIPEDLREFVEARVREFGYSSASEYVEELIRKAQKRVTKERKLRELLGAGLEQLRRGETLKLDEASLPAFFEEVKARARKRRCRGNDRRT